MTKAEFQNSAYHLDKIDKIQMSMHVPVFVYSRLIFVTL